MPKLPITAAFIFLFSLAASAQADKFKAAEKYPNINPLLFTSFKNPAKANLLLSEYIKPSKHELMYWPNYPLTAAQIEPRDREWERRNKQTIGGQIISDIASDIIKTQVNTLIYGKKPVAVTPKF